MAGNLTIHGGHFQDAEGNVLNLGYLLFELSHDEQYTIGSSQIVAGLKFRITLDSNGDIPASPAVKIYSNDVMLPSGSFYIVRAFKSDGTEAWAAPQYWQLTASPNPLDVGTIVPANPPGSGLSGTGGATLLLQTNEANNGDQSLLDLHAGTGVTLTDNGSGRVTIASSLATLTLETNGVANGSQTILNLSAGSNVSLADNGTGTVTITSSPSGPRPNIANWHGWTWIGGATTNTGTSPGYGAFLTQAGATPTYNSIGATATEPPYFEVATSAGVGNCNGIYVGGANQDGGTTLGILKDWQTRIKISATASIRLWIGLYDASRSTPIGTNDFAADTLARSFVGFRYSTNAGDTVWQAVANNAGSQTTTPTSVAPSAVAGHVFEIQPTGGGASLTFLIDGVSVATVATNLPTTSTLLRAVNDVERLGASDVAMDTAYIYWETLP